MSHDVIADNWSLQNVSELLSNSFDSEGMDLVIPDRSADSHILKEVSTVAVAIEALFDLITDIVLRNQILVDGQFSDAWIGVGRPLMKLSEQSIVRSFPFLQDPERLSEPREEFASKLCVTKSLRLQHQENVHGWHTEQVAPHPYLSQVLWGGAGMLARAFVFEKGCTPHPVRRRLFQEAGITLLDEVAATRVTNTIREKRASIRAVHSSNDELYSLQINLDPLPIVVLRDASSIKDIPNVAMQIRDEYVELRNWLGEYQLAISAGDFKSIEKHQKTLRSISQYVDAKMGKTSSDSPTFTTGIDILKVALKGQPVNAIKNRFGVHSMINKLILDSSGAAELKKLLRLLGHLHSEIGLKVIEHFSQKHT